MCRMPAFGDHPILIANPRRIGLRTRGQIIKLSCFLHGSLWVRSSGLSFLTIYNTVRIGHRPNVSVSLKNMKIEQCTLFHISQPSICHSLSPRLLCSLLLSAELLTLNICENIWNVFLFRCRLSSFVLKDFVLPVQHTKCTVAKLRGTLCRLGCTCSTFKSCYHYSD